MASSDPTAQAPRKSAKPAARSNRDSLRWTAGLLLFFFGLFAAAAVLFYYFDWKADASILSGLHRDNPDPSLPDEVENPCGYAGAWLAEQLVGRSFGVFGIVLPLIVTMIGVRIIRRRPLLLNHSALSSLLVLLLGSLTLGFLFGDAWDVFGSGWGGAFGIEIARLLRGVIGAVGVSILLLGGWILTGVFINRNFINTVNSAGSAVVGKGGRFVERVKRSVVHPSAARQTPTDSPQEADGDDAAAGPKDTNKTESSETEPNASDIAVSATAVAATVAAGPCPEPSVVAEGDDDCPFIELSTSEAPLEIVTGTPQPEVPEQMPGVVAEEGPFIEVDLAREPESPLDNAEATEDEMVEGLSPDSVPEEPEGVVVTVETHEAKVVDEARIGSGLYDPLRDLNDYRRPPVSLLEDYANDSQVSDEEIYENKSRIEETLKNFGIPIQRIKATVGPTVTLYEIVQAQGVKISRIQGLENDIAQSLKALGIRIIAPIPGKGTIGIEVPNRDKQVVSMHSSVRSLRFQESKAELPVVIGRTIQNENYVFDLARMPHLLVAGATGQGKSVGLNAIITSLLYRKHPAQLKFVMIDPKMVEFSLYAKIERHFLAKMESEDDAIITDPRKAVYTLNALCTEMDARLELCKKAGARNIAEYNAKFTARRLNPLNGHRFLPYIVVVVDEFADLIMTAREVEGPVMRLAQKARAIGIHLIIATQRPDVKVITGGIKANFPARIAFRVMQMIDSRTIIDQPGANQLIGRGDMLFSKDGELTRIQCALVETREVERIVDYIAKQQGYASAYNLPDYVPESGGEGQALGSENSAPLKYDALFADIARAAVSQGQISTSSIQRNYEVGFNRAGRIMMQLERAGIVGRQEGAKPRDILFHDLPSLEAKLQKLGVF